MVNAWAGAMMSQKGRENLPDHHVSSFFHRVEREQR